MASFLLRIVTNAAGLYVAAWLVPGFTISGGWREYALAAVVLAALNLLVRPVLKLISLPLIILTLGLFTIVINAAILWAVDYAFAFVTIGSLTALFLATAVVSAVNMLSSHK